jgi:hypothetical protein
MSESTVTSEFSFSFFMAKILISCLFPLLLAVYLHWDLNRWVSSVMLCACDRKKFSDLISRAVQQREIFCFAWDGDGNLTCLLQNWSGVGATACLIKSLQEHQFSFKFSLETAAAYWKASGILYLMFPYEFSLVAAYGTDISDEADATVIQQS